jgi:hypothetical protein
MTRKYQVKNRDSVAERLLDRSIQEINLPNNLLAINILVPCAGSFPSYVAFLKILEKHFRKKPFR